VTVPELALTIAALVAAAAMLIESSRTATPSGA
jgi:hypothetical protein